MEEGDDFVPYTLYIQRCIATCVLNEAIRNTKCQSLRWIGWSLMIFIVFIVYWAQHDSTHSKKSVRYYMLI